MNISPNSLSSNVSKVNFGRECDVEDVQKILQLSEELSDSFQCKPSKKTKDDAQENKAQHKHPMQIAVSVIGTALATFVIGKSVASKVTTAFPKLTDKLTGVIRKGANFVRDFSDDVVNGVKLKKGGKTVKELAKGTSKLEKKARELFVKNGATESIKNIVGIGSAVAIAPEIISIDGNNDGVADIGQKKVNAYKNFLSQFGTFSGIVESLS